MKLGELIATLQDLENRYGSEIEVGTRSPTEDSYDYDYYEGVEAIVGYVYRVPKGHYMAEYVYGTHVDVMGSPQKTVIILE